MLGKFYASKGSYIVEHDKTKAFEWTLKAAEAGDEVAMLDLIEIYRDGIGVEKDSEKSLYWKKNIEALKQ
ncbi:Sel1 repeat protein [compost metagenome]